jgi:hypothetical protein
VHDWYRFVLSFPPHLVRDRLADLAAGPDTTVLDPFCGTGTTLVECKKLGLASIGIEANPMATFASRVKVDWSVDPDRLGAEAVALANAVGGLLAAAGYGENDELPLLEVPGKSRAEPPQTLPPDVQQLLLADSISPVPLHKLLVLLDALRKRADPALTGHLRLAVAKVAVFGASNLSFGPEVGLGKIRHDAPVISLWLNAVRAMAADLRNLGGKGGAAAVHQGDARQPGRWLTPESVDVVITSPPYPNEKDYTRTTRLESVLLGFVRSRQELRGLKQGLVRSNTRGVYVSDLDDRFVEGHEVIQGIADQIERRRIEMGKSSGFEKLYARVTRLYFGGLAQHLAELRAGLRPGARLHYVVGDQASYLQVLIRTGEILASLADELGYEVAAIDLFRTRLATATRQQLREEVVVLRWPGPRKRRRKAAVNKNAYTVIIEHLFHSKYKQGARHIDFRREEIAEVAQTVGVELPKNLGDLIYSFRYRAALPPSIQETAGAGEAWLIRPAGRAQYRFVLARENPVVPNPALSITKIPDATPGVVAKYALSDEQALLAKVRYNRLLDIFTGVACYSLQSHLRTTVPEVGQAETDEIYIGIDRRGRHFVLPVQAKGGSDRLNIVQIEQDIAICGHKFPSLICRPVAAQFMEGGTIALFEFEEGDEGVTICEERHYRLVPFEDLSAAELASYHKQNAN